jgi:hypothetical protein
MCIEPLEMSCSRVVLSPTEGWAVESVTSCCHRYAVDFVFSRYEGSGSSRKGVEAMSIGTICVLPLFQ